MTQKQTSLPIPGGNGVDIGAIEEIKFSQSSLIIRLRKLHLQVIPQLPGR